jgi:hypothetical protein
MDRRLVTDPPDHGSAAELQPQDLRLEETKTMTGILTVGEMRQIAAAYRTQAEIMTGMGHDMMLDQGWPEVADRIDTWVRELGK